MNKKKIFNAILIVVGITAAYANILSHDITLLNKHDGRIFDNTQRLANRLNLLQGQKRLNFYKTYKDDINKMGVDYSKSKNFAMTLELIRMGELLYYKDKVLTDIEKVNGDLDKCRVPKK